MPIFVLNMRKCYLLKGWLSKADIQYTNRCSKYKKKSSKQLFLDEQPKYEKHVIEVSVEENINVKPI